jgi:hypothetical protein
MLIPQNPLLQRAEFILGINCGQDGPFEFSAVRPGEYYGIAIARNGPTPWYQAMRDEAFLKQTAR